jgi:hypothetical protein
MGTIQKNKGEYDEKEAQRRFQQTLRGALATPHKKHEPLKPKATPARKSKRGAKHG